MRFIKHLTMKKRFQGSLVGSVIGDCLGSPFEMSYWDNQGIKEEEILKVLEKKGQKRKATSFESSSDYSRYFKYTDDTAMTKSICESLIGCKSYNPTNMAERFTQEYMAHKSRGYGGNIISVFQQWDVQMKSESGITKENVYTPSQSQFDGSGSYGNGAAMRVSPVALFARSTQQCCALAKNTGLLTHSNKQGYNGAVLQALVVRKALNLNTSVEPSEFIDQLISEMSTVEGDCSSKQSADEDLHTWTRSPGFTYTAQLRTMKELLATEKPGDVKSAIELLGRDVSAQQAVPAALFSFLRTESFRAAILYAISLGGDTDTIASMCGAIAGAYYGVDSIPTSWLKCCEYVKEMTVHADQLYNIYTEGSC